MTSLDVHRSFLGRRLPLLRAVMVLVAIAAIAGVAASSATAAEGAWGSYVTGSGYCWDNRDLLGNRIYATSPVMYPVPSAGASDVYTQGGGQWVGFRVTLLRWNGSAWAASQVSALKLQYASNSAPYVSGTWYDTSKGVWESGLTTFPIAYRGPYKLLYDLYWYTNGQVSGHVRDFAYGGLRDDRLTSSSLSTNAWSYVEWCQY